MDLKPLIMETRSRLFWPVREVVRGDTLEIISDHIHKVHTIHIPAASGGIRDIEYLHELAHATLCEQAHPMFSTWYFASDTPARIIEEITPACRTANEWFAEGWLMQVAPAAERAEVEEHLQLVFETLRGAGSEQSAVILYGAALIIAQAIAYCGAQIRCGGLLQDAVTAFLSVRPDLATLPQLELLINRLLSVGYPYRLSCCRENDLDVWLVQ